MKEVKCSRCGKVIGDGQCFISSPRKQADNGGWVYERIVLLCKDCFDKQDGARNEQGTV